MASWGQIVDAIGQYYINQGSQNVVENLDLRQKITFFGTEIVKRIWKYAPTEFTLETSGTVSLTSGVGPAPLDFAFMSKQGGVFTSSRPQIPLKWVPPQTWGSLVQLVGGQGTPYWWTLMDTTTAGRREIRTYP